MAYGKNTGLQYRPLQGDLASDILDQEDQASKMRAEQRLNADRKAKAQAEKDLKKKQEDDEYQKNLEKVYVKPTGYKSHDEPTVKILQGENGILATYSKILDELEENPRDQNLIIKKLNLEKSVEQLKGLREGIVSWGGSIQKGVEDGTLSPSLNKGFIDNYNALIKDFQYDYKIDDIGNLVVENKGYDPEQDGIPNELSLADLYDKDKMKAYERFNPVSWIKGTTELYGKFTTQTDNGITKQKLSGFDMSKLDNLGSDISTLFGEDLSNITPEAKSYIGDTLNMDFKSIDNESFKKIKSDLATRVINAYEKTNITDVDGGTALANKKYNDENVKGISFVESNQYGNGKNAVAQRYSFNSPYVIKGTNKSDKPSTLYEIRYDQENGQVVLMGEEYVGSTTSKTSEGGSGNVPQPRTQEEFEKSQNNQGDSKTTTSKTEGRWKPITITDKAEVTSVLSKVMGVGSYEEIVNQLKRDDSEEEDTSTNNNGVGSKYNN